MKICTGCNKEKSDEDFDDYLNKRLGQRVLKARCKSCTWEYEKERRKRPAARQKLRASDRKRKLLQDEAA